MLYPASCQAAASSMSSNRPGISACTLPRSAEAQAMSEVVSSRGPRTRIPVFAVVAVEVILDALAGCGQVQLPVWHSDVEAGLLLVLLPFHVEFQVVLEGGEARGQRQPRCRLVAEIQHSPEGAVRQAEAHVCHGVRFSLSTVLAYGPYVWSLVRIGEIEGNLTRAGLRFIESCCSVEPVAQRALLPESN